MKDVERMLQLYRENYFDFEVRHFHEKLVEEHGIQLSYRWVKLALQTAGWWINRSAAEGIGGVGRVGCYRGCCCTSMPASTFGFRTGDINNDRRRIARSAVVGLCDVSTIFLRIDRGFGGEPRVRDHVLLGRHQPRLPKARTATWLEVEQTHRSIVAECRRPWVMLRALAEVVADGRWRFWLRVRLRWKKSRGKPL